MGERQSNAHRAKLIVIVRRRRNELVTAQAKGPWNRKNTTSLFNVFQVVSGERFHYPL